MINEKADQNGYGGEGFTQFETAAVIRAAAAAPSLYNSQPWRFDPACGEIRLHLDPLRRSPHVDPRNRQQIIACGAALLNMRLATQQLGYEARVLLWPDPAARDHVATVRRGPAASPTAEDRRLWAQVHRRHTNREWFGLRGISPAARQTLRYVAGSEGVALRPVDSASDQQILYEMLVAAIRGQREDRGRAREMMQWLRSAPADDGMPIASWSSATFPVPGLAGTPGGEDWERRVATLVRSHQFLLLISPSDSPDDWLAAGQGLQRVLLKATQLDLAVSFFNQIIENPELRRDFMMRLGARGAAQMMLRIGYPTRAPRAFSGRRRHLDVTDPPTT